jgi:hypothetical protein
LPRSVDFGKPRAWLPLTQINESLRKHWYYHDDAPVGAFLPGLGPANCGALCWGLGKPVAGALSCKPPRRTMEGCGALRDCRFLLHDRDIKFTQSFRAIIASGRVESLALPARSPNLNACSERWVRSVKEECLSKIILFGERSLPRALGEYVEHYRAERNHQGKDNVLQRGSIPRSNRLEPRFHILAIRGLGPPDERLSLVVWLKYYAEAPICSIEELNRFNYCSARLVAPGKRRVHVA